MAKVKKNASVNNNDRQNFLIKICATTGLLFLLPLIGVVLIVSGLLYQSYQDIERQIAVVVVKNGKGKDDILVEFVINGIRYQQTIYSQEALVKGAEIKVWITNDDPTTIQFTKPTHEIRSVYWYMLTMLLVAIIVNILLYVYVPSVVCFLLILNIVMFIVSAMKVRIKK